MAVLAKFIEGAAFGGLDTVLSHFLGGKGEDGYALPSRYEVIITPPTPIGRAVGGGDLVDVFVKSPGSTNTQTASKISLRCEAISLPGMNLTSTPDSNMYGVPAEIVDGVSFADTINMTFQASSDLEERVVFERWQEQAWDRETWNIKYYKDYTAPIDIYVLDLQNNKKYGVRLHECYPKTIEAVPLSYANATDIIKINVSMQYRYWETLNITAQPRGLGDKLFDVLKGNIGRTINANLPRVLSKLG